MVLQYIGYRQLLLLMCNMFLILSDKNLRLVEQVLHISLH